MRLSPLQPAQALLASLLLLSHVTLVFPLPVPPSEETPLPGRTQISKDKNGVITGHVGDDFLPAHMRHVQKNQAEYPDNTKAFQLNDGDDRKAKIGGSNVVAGPHPVTGESRVKDEKPLNIQKIPGGQNHGTTMQLLPHTESGGAPKTPGQIKYEADVPKASQPSRGDLPDNVKTEGSLASKMKAAAEAEKKNGSPGGGTTKIRPNPGWLPLKEDQLRGHEAPAVMTNQKDGADRNSPPPPQPASKGAKPAEKGKEKATADPEPKDAKPADKEKGKAKADPEHSKPPTPGTDAADKKEEDNRRKSSRPATVADSAKAGQPRPPKPPSAPGSSNKTPATEHPNYRASDPQVPNQYKPGGAQTKSPTPGISPPKEDPNRLPPRPQNGATGPPKPGPPRKSLPPPEKPKAKDDTAVSYSGTHNTLPAGQKNGHNFPPLNLPGGPPGPPGGGPSKSPGGPPPPGGSKDLPSRPPPKGESNKGKPPPPPPPSSPNKASTSKSEAPKPATPLKAAVEQPKPKEPKPAPAQKKKVGKK